MPSQLNVCGLSRGDRVFHFKDGATVGAVISLQPKPYELRRGDRLFYFKDAASNVPEKGSTSGQGTVDKR